jgi:NDP-sugar pyrophosphorylase family protein
MKIEEIYAITPDSQGWRKLPSGAYVKLGNDVTVGNNVTLGYGVTLGNSVTLGNNVKLGDGVNIGNDVTLGNYVKLGDGVKLGNDVTLGNGVTLGHDVKLGNNVQLGNYVTSLDLARQYRQNYITAASEHIFVKWVTSQRMSPGWGSATPIKYEVGSTIEVEGEANDQQCAPGLHVFRFGERPEWHGLCEANHDLIPLRVRVKSEDILFAGLPTMDAKLRVRKLEVLD